jgi:LPS-assembly lipoprotein
MRTRAAHALLLAAVLAAVAGCGFRLQGKLPLPASLAVTYIEAEDAQSDFVQDLRRSLLASGARLTAVRSEATAIVRLQRDEFLERVVSVSGRNVPREYELTYTVRFAVDGPAGNLLPSDEVAASRDFSFDERAVLAKEREQEMLREALARDLVGVVMRRFSALP